MRMRIHDTTEPYLSYVTVGYHLNQIKKSTGIDPRSFYGLCKLVQMAKQIGG